MATLPKRFERYVPAGHALEFRPKRTDITPVNKEASGGMNRRDWIICSCGNGLRIEGPPTESEWLEAINQCRLAVHGPKSPCLPVTMDGVEQVVREAPVVTAAKREPVGV